MFINVRCVFPSVSRHAIGCFTPTAIRESMNCLTVALTCAAAEISTQATHLKALQFRLTVPGLTAAVSKVADLGFCDCRRMAGPCVELRAQWLPRRLSAMREGEWSCVLR
jgi:hypothetical protein